jgi:hypothetical protein
MAGATGLEPATSGVTGRRSNQLSYAPVASRPGRHSYPSLQEVSSRPRQVPIPRSTVTNSGLVGDDGLEPPTLSV